MAAAAATTPTLPRASDLDNVMYRVILYSILFTALSIFVIERFEGINKFGSWIFPQRPAAERNQHRQS